MAGKGVHSGRISRLALTRRRTAASYTAAREWFFGTPATIETMRPNATLYLRNLAGAYTDIDDDPDSPDASWLVV